jgi:hypothetical protein
MARQSPNQSWSQPLAVAIRPIDFVKQFLMFATLAPTSSGSAHSR